ncbi:hypothetical protein V6N13_019909 [Hibiscus sabdariffa]|uniref:Uncharacterized protein n=1 Tax=Hibiscus sabdariffa TaxID=183260 RepID=A0ABR2ETP4_9ROSI
MLAPEAESLLADVGQDAGSRGGVSVGLCGKALCGAGVPIFFLEVEHKPPATCFIALIWAADPTLETEIPTLIAVLIPALNRSVDKKICPSVMEITLVGIYAETSPDWVSTIGKAVILPSPN